MMTPFQLLSYAVLALIGLYLIYLMSISLMSLLWFLIRILIFGGLLGVIVWFLHKKGFFELFKS